MVCCTSLNSNFTREDDTVLGMGQSPGAPIGVSRLCPPQSKDVNPGHMGSGRNRDAD